MEMKDRVVVITGGSGGIGQAMARAFLAEGAKQIVLADLHEDAVQAAANHVSSLHATMQALLHDKLLSTAPTRG